ncbi:DMT family transporter [Ottowia sp.]|uniref:DMT family transporter n=1 Tax=Ottowia sp. TaxID=1898956 RepID=UPI003A85C82E
MNGWLALGVAIVAEVMGTSALKASDGFSRPLPTLVVVAGYGLAFWMLSITTRSVPVGLAYAIWSGLGTVLIALVAWALYGQRLDAWSIVGMALIVAGVLVMNLLSNTPAH